MSTTIDQKVLEMRFDNKQFEAGVSTTMSSLEKLKQKLNLSGASKGLENVGAAARGVKLGGLSSAADEVAVRFSALGIMGVTALQRITNAAIDTGNNMIKALTIDPIMSGFSEYETKINAIQTIMSNTASKGTTMEDVTRVLNELNTYADKTIYNFAEMTRNIGTFTAAGVGLEESAAAIQGIANLAAASGSNSQQASTAMYQLSQALAAGTVKLMDWNSVVNAGMGGEKFQEALKATAREYGINVDAIIKKNGSFRESLQEGWISADILNTTLKKFTEEGAAEYAKSMLESGKYTQAQADALMAEAKAMTDAATKVKTFTQLWDTMKESAQSGWAQTWELIIGDFEEAKSFLSEVSDVIGGIIGDSADARNAIISGALRGGEDAWGNLTKRINDAGIATDDFKKALIETAKSHGINIDEMIKKEGSFEATLKNGWLSGKIISDTINKYIGGMGDASKATESMTDTLENFQKVVDAVWRGEFGNGAERIEALTKAGHDYAAVQDLVNKTVDGHRLTLKDLSDVQLRSVGFTDEQVKALRELAKEAEKTGTPLNELIESMSKPSGRELLIDTVRIGLNNLKKSVEAVGRAWEKIFPQKETSAKLYNLIDGIHSFAESLDITRGGIQTSSKRIQNLQATFEGLFAIIDIVATLTGGTLRFAFKAVSTVLGMFDMDILDATASIGKFLVKVRDWIDAHNPLNKAIELVAPAIQTAVEAVNEWIDAFLELPIVQKHIKKFQSALSNAFTKIQNAFSNITYEDVLAWGSGIGEAFQSLFTSLMEIDSWDLDAIKGVFQDFISECSEYFSGLDLGLDGIGEALRGFYDDVVQFFEPAITKFNEKKDGAIEWIDNFIEKMTEVYEKVKTFLSGITFEDVIDVAKMAAVVLVLWQLYRALKNFADFPGALTDTFDQLAGSLKAFKWSIAAGVFKDMAIAVAIISLSIAGLAQLDWQEAWKAAVAVGAIIVVLMGVMVGMTAIGNKFGGLQNFKMAAVALALVGLATGVLMLIQALKSLDGVKWEDCTDGLMILGTLLGSLAISGAILGLAKGGLLSAAIGILGIAGSLFVFKLALEEFADSDLTTLQTGVDNLVKLLVPLGIFIAGVGIFSKNASLIGAAATIISLVGALYLLEGVLKLYNDMEWDVFLSGAAKIGILAAALLVFLTVVSEISSNGEDKNGLFKTLLTMVVGMVTLTAAVMVLSIWPWDMLLQGVAAAVTLILALGGALKLASSFNSGKGVAGIIAMAGAVVAFTASLIWLVDVPWESLLASTLALSALMIAFGGALALASSFASLKAVLGIVAMVIPVAAFVAGLLFLADVPWDSLIAAAGSLAILMTTLSFALVIASSGGTIAGAAAMIVASVGILALSGALLVLASVPFGALMGAVLGLALALAALVAAAFGMQTFAVGAGVLIGVLASLSVTFLTVAAAAVGIGVAILAVGAAFYLVGESLTPIGEGISAVGRGIADMINTVAGASGSVGTFAEVMVTLGGSIFILLTNIAGGILAAAGAAVALGAGAVVLGAGIVVAAAAVALLAGGLALLGLSLQVVGTGVIVVAEAFVYAVEIILAAFEGIGLAASEIGANIVNGIANGITNTVNAVIESIANVGSSIIGTICDVLGIHSPSTVMTEIGQYAGDGLSIGLDNSAGKVSESSSYLADIIAGNLNVSGSTGEQGSNAVSSFASGMDLSSFLADGSSFDIAQLTSGNFDISSLTSQFGSDAVGSFAEGMDLSAFTAEGSAFDIASLTSGEFDISSLTSMFGSEAAGAFSSGLFSGQQDAASSAGSVSNSALEGLSGSAEQFKMEGKSAGSAYVEGLNAGLSSAKPSIGPVISALKTSLNSNLSSFKSAGSDLVKAFSTGISSSGSIAAGALTQTLGASLSRIVNTYPGMFRSAGQQIIVQFSVGVNSQGSNVMSSTMQIMSMTLTRVRAVYSAQFQMTGQALMIQFASGIKAKSTFVVTIVTAIIGAVLSRIRSHYAQFQAAGQTLMTFLAAGELLGKPLVINSITVIMGNAVGAIESYYDDFSSAGGYVVDGLAAGIRNRQSVAVAAARNMAAAVEAAARARLQIASPSVVFMYVGEYVAEGLAVGIQNGTGEAEDAAENLAERVIAAHANAIDRDAVRETYTAILEEYDKFIEEYNARTDKLESTTDSFMDSANIFGAVQRQEAVATEALTGNLEDQIAQMQEYRDIINSLNERITNSDLLDVVNSKGLESIETLRALNSMTDEELTRYQELYEEKYVLSQEIAAERVEDIHEEALSTEDQYWADLLEIKRNGADAERYNSMSLLEFQRDILSQTASLYEEYTTQLEDAAEKLMDSSGIFDEVQAQEAVSAAELTKNLEDQVDQMAEYTTTMESLNERITNDDFVEAINQMGVESLAELQALNSMTDEELSTYVELWEQKFALCQAAAEVQLGGLRDEMAEQLGDLFGGIEVDFGAFEAAFDGTLESIREYISGAIGEVADEGLSANQDEIAEQAAVAGEYLVDGFVAGIDEHTWEAEAAAAAMARAAVEAAEEELDINSPSRVFFGIGKYAGLGFVNALGGYAENSYIAGEEVAKSAIRGISDAVVGITNAIDNDLDAEPVIRPVLDLTNVESGTKRINALMSRGQALAVNATMNRVASDRFNDLNHNGETGSTYNFTQNNYSPKALSRAEIYRQTRNQFSVMERMVSK